MKRDPLKLHHPFFLPVGRRVIVTGACLAWGAAEFALGNAGWSALFVSIGAYLVYEFFYRFDPENYRDKDDDPK